jgi:hypothetical protein
VHDEQGGKSDSLERKKEIGMEKLMISFGIFALGGMGW